MIFHAIHTNYLECHIPSSSCKLMATDVRQKIRVTLIAALVNLLTGSGKLFFGLSGQSQALIADGIHSLSDLLTDILTLVAIALGSKSADRDHPYGHARFETLAAVVLGLSLISVAGGIIWDATERIQQPKQLLHPDQWVLLMAVLSIVANELLYQYTRQVARCTRSNLLLANAWHHRTDAISSVFVVIGVLATQRGYPIADAIAAILVGVMISKVGLDLIIDSLGELVDTGLPSKTIKYIRASIMATGGVNAIHLLRSRRMGANALIDVHILVEPRISVSEAHLVSEAVRHKLMNDFEEIDEVLIHVDPEDDEIEDVNTDLPLRNEVLAELEKCWKQTGIIGNIQSVNLHYLGGLVEIEVIIPRALIFMLNNVDHIEQQFSHAVNELDFVSSISVYYS